MSVSLDLLRASTLLPGCGSTSTVGHHRDEYTCQTWTLLISRYFDGVFDQYWNSSEYSDRHGEQDFRLPEPREIKLPHVMTFEDSRTLKTDTGQDKTLGFFEYVQLLDTLLEQYFREYNIPPTSFNRRTGCLLELITTIPVRNHV